ncbi:SDR family oxidoreductase [Streptomyces sp. NPDC017448]|uniref:SDR family oxidoreductase n=1 Tax=Streptomyces sp. NPDC017448 TaxID=3364996 RepID=UPI00378998F8
MTPRPAKFLPPGDKCVLVTGASSGLGRACALQLARVGFRVFAGVRRLPQGEELAALSPSGRIRPVRIDVTDEESVAAAVKEITGETGGAGLWGLVNNAGIAVSAPLECVTPERMRQQFDTNVIGQLTVTQGALPLLRRSGGRVVNVTSGLGSVAMPFLGAYAAAQFAKEAMSDVLRRELRRSGVGVCVVQPGAITTPIWGKLTDAARRDFDDVPPEAAAPYRTAFGRFLDASDQQTDTGTRPEDFARTVFRALTSDRPRTRYQVGKDARSLYLLKRVLSDRAMDRRLRAITD